MSAVELLSDLGVIVVKLSGSVALRDRAEALEALLQLQARTACRKVLVDLADAALVDSSNAETFEHAARLARDPVMRGLRIAYVGDAGSAISVESLAALRGYFYQRFRSRASALRWLCGSTPAARAA